MARFFSEGSSSTFFAGIVGKGVIGWLRCCGHDGDAVRCVETVPEALGHDDDHARGHLEACRARFFHDRERGGTSDHLDQFITVAVALPRALTREAAGEKAAIAELGKRGEGFAGQMAKAQTSAYSAVTSVTPPVA